MLPCLYRGIFNYPAHCYIIHNLQLCSALVYASCTLGTKWKEFWKFTRKFSAFYLDLTLNSIALFLQCVCVIVVTSFITLKLLL